jgi:hypothetical protein
MTTGFLMPYQRMNEAMMTPEPAVERMKFRHVI